METLEAGYIQEKNTSIQYCYTDRQKLYWELMQMPHIEAGPAKEGTASLFNGKNSKSVTNVYVPTATSCTSTMAEFFFVRVLESERLQKERRHPIHSLNRFIL